MRERERERKGKNVRMKEMLEKPGSQNVDRSFRQASLGSPSLLFHHPHLMKRSLLPQALFQHLQPWCLSFGQPRVPCTIFLSQHLTTMLQLCCYCLKLLYSFSIAIFGLLDNDFSTFHFPSIACNTKGFLTSTTSI